MKIMDVPKGTKVRIIADTAQIPPSALPVDKEDIVTVGNLDGMYVNGTNENGDRVYLTAWTEVEKI